MRIRSSWGGSPNIRAVQGAASNARGRDFEDYLDRACQLYRNIGIANIEKTPEPFKCLKKNKGGRAIVQFIHHAQPDYKGVLLNGQAIIFEAKCTTKDKIQQSVRQCLLVYRMNIFSFRSSILTTWGKFLGTSTLPQMI